ncbi:MAG: carbohydrate porin, partial [Planctomycetota bacterium]
MEKMKSTLCIAATVFCLAGLCQAEDSLREKLAKLDASSQGQEAASNSTFAQRFDSSAFVRRFGLVEAQVKLLEEAGRSRDSRISKLEVMQEILQGAAEARDLKMSDLERRLQAIETRVRTRQSDDSSRDRVSEPELNVSEDASESSPSPQTIDSSALLTTSSNFAADVPLPADDPARPKVETGAVNKPMPVSAPVVADPDDTDIWNRETLTNGFGGLADKLADSGIEIGLSMTNIYQANIRGGLDTHGRKGRHTGSYDLEIGADLEKLWGIEGGSLLAHAEGSWSRSDTDTESVGSVFGINADAGGRRAMDLTELWYEQAMFDDTLRLRLGKMDITGGF